ncbi:hypothetical protein pqer_cds_1161 [Pandoravirus quercus]|uniref:Ankyrin repeat domain containing protein n=1 Tax=Pandoravirus quercus TaxID=2107709 RepID=A0A2U7UAV7_9VIRU|nr:hypothetical protein pqer_cds_1161 [Pandoravirus quercus]AVK75583.1 hypothetical protein pqer_cds_1161 [Pandoravirus quercus]
MQEAACDVGLARLPPELMDHIASFLPRVADIAACLCASPLFRPMRIDSALVRLFDGNVVDVIERGAPLAIVEVVRGRSPATEALLLPAVRGGRLDVLERFCGSPMRPLFCTSGLLPDAGLVRCYSHDTGLVHWGYAEKKDHRGYPSSGVGALFEAIACGRADMVDRLLDFGAIASVTPPPPDLGVECMLRAARKGHLDVMQVIHRRIVGGTLPRRASSTAGCGCAPLVGQSAFNDDQPEAAEWLDRCGCDGAYRPVNNSLGRAVEAGHFGIARWLIDKAETHGAKYDVGPFSVFLAVKLGAAAVVALVYDWYPLRHQDSDPDRNLEIGQVLAEAAARGHMDILRWAAGEPVPDPNVRQRSEPVPVWHTGCAAWGAAAAGRVDVMEWLLGRPEAARIVPVEAIDAGLSRGHVSIALAAHRAGIAPLDQWGALGAAVRSGHVEVVAAVADAGAKYRRSALAGAVERGHVEIVAYLCKRYGAADAQHAIDRSHRSPQTAWPAVCWLRDNVEGVCTARVYGSGCAFVRYCWTGTPCRCLGRCTAS